jgi:hypothetical protein
MSWWSNQEQWDSGACSTRRRENKRKVFAGKPEGKRPLGKPGADERISEQIFKKDYRSVDWIHLAQGRDQWLTLFNTKWTFGFHKMKETINFSRKSLPSWLSKSVKRDIHRQHCVTSCYHSSELLGVNTMHEHKFCSWSRMTEQTFVSVYHVHSVSIDNILVRICEV